MMHMIFSPAMKLLWEYFKTERDAHQRADFDSENLEAVSNVKRMTDSTNCEKEFELWHGESEKHWDV